MELDIASFQCTCISRSSNMYRKMNIFLLKFFWLFGSNFGSKLTNS